MSEGLLAYGRAKMIEYGIVTSGDAKNFGIGAMTDRRWKAFFSMMSSAGLYPADMDWRSAYSVDFVALDRVAR